MVANKRWRRQAMALAVVATLCACQTLNSVPYVGEHFANAISPTGALPAPVARQWPDARPDLIRQQARGYGLAQIPELQAYLNGLLARIKATAGVADWPGAVFVLATPAMDAFASAAGNIYISYSYVVSAPSEDALIALLAHEFGHVYLHYHQIEGVVEGADQTAGIAAIGVALAHNKQMSGGWTPVDSLRVGYFAGKDLAVGHYGRSEEDAADDFALNVSLKLGYSYATGVKSFLEMIASWEQANAERRQQQEAQLRAAMQAREASDKSRPAPAKAQANDATIQAKVGEINAEIAKLWDKHVSAAHPETSDRIERQASASEKLPDALLSKDPVVAPLAAVKARPPTAIALQNYQSAAEVLQDAGAAQALDKARKAASGPTATHAMPLIALYEAQRAAKANANAPRRSKQSVDPGKILELNFNSPPDRAWRSYLERALQLQANGDAAAAKKTIDSGLAVFRQAPDAWPQAIRFYGETQGWKLAKAMAGECATEHHSAANACREAALSPAERREAELRAQQKGDQIGKDLVKKVSK